MTIKDIQLIDDLLTEVTNSIAVGELREMEREEYYQEVLRRYNGIKNGIKDYKKALTELKEGKIECSPIMKEFIDKFLNLGNTFNYGFGPNIQQKQPEIELEKFTEKIKTFQGRYKHPEIVSIKGAMAFMARMFYQYPNVARLWYEQLPKATMDFNARKEN